MTIDEMVEAVERDRKRRETGLSLFLLALAEKSRSFVNKAVRIGSGWASALGGVLLGNEALDLPGGVPFLSRGMAESHHSAVARVGRMLAVPVAPRRVLHEQAVIYQPVATAVLERIRDTLAGAIDEGLREATEADRIAADVRAVSEAYRAKGWASDNPRSAEAEGTAAVTRSYAAGMREAFVAPEVVEILSGLRFVNPLDETTTGICRALAGTKLPLDHPWWFANWPPLHWGCRSIVLPVRDRIQFTSNPPTYPPPEEGWGSYAGML